MDKLNISTLNCEGLCRSKDYIRTYLDNNSCDILAFQETWHLDNNNDCFSTIHDSYMYTAICVVDASKNILAGRPNGGVAILLKKSSCNKINIIKTINRRIYVIRIIFGKQIVCLLLSVYLPCDNYTSSASAEFTECIDYIESLFNRRIAMLLFVVEILTLILRDRMDRQNVLIASLREILYVFLGTIQFPKKILHTQIYL